MKIALIDKQPSNINYSKWFEFEFDQYHLCQTPKTKILKKDVDINFNSDDYNIIVLVGSEATKYYTGGSIGELGGHIVQDKYIPIQNPSMLIFRPELKESFANVLKKLHKNISGDLTVKKHGSFIGITDEEQAIEYLKNILEEGGPVALDTETTALYPRDGEVLGISISNKVRDGAYILSEVFGEECVKLLQEIINNNIVVFHNAKFDMAMLSYHFGLKFREEFTHDTLLMHYMLDETVGSHGLKDLALKFTDYGDYDRALEEFKASYIKLHGIPKEEFNYSFIPFDIISVYAAIDPAVTLELYNKFMPVLEAAKEVGTAYRSIVIPGLFFITEMESNGIPFDKERLEWAKDYILQKLYIANKELYELPEIEEFQKLRKLQGEKDPKFNPNSPTQLRTFLFDYLNIPSPGKLTAAGALSTDAEVLEDLKDTHPIVNHILTIRKYTKILNTYIVGLLLALDRDGRVRTNFNMSTTTSGRLSSSGKFNAQQLIRDDPIVKGTIVAQEGRSIVSQDLATAEMYYAAVLSGDKNLQKAFIDKEDFHSSIAKQVFKLKCTADELKKLFPDERQAAKAISFGILYGSGPDKVSKTVSKSSSKEFSLEDAIETINKYFEAFPQLRKWLNSCKERIKQNGYIYSFFGRKRRLKEVFSVDKAIAGHAVRSGINFLVQSVASDVNLLAAIEINKEIKRQNIDAKIIMLVHDSIVADVKNEDVDRYCKLAKEITQKDRGISIVNCPIGVDQDIGQDYSFGEFDRVYGSLFKEYQISSIPAF